MGRRVRGRQSPCKPPEALARLDSAGMLGPGHGKVDLLAGLDRSHAWASLGVEATVKNNVSLFAEATASRAFSRAGLDYRAIAGARWRW